MKTEERPENILADLYSQYRESVLPMLEKLEDISEDRQRPLNCLNEMRALGDHISRCFMDDVDEQEMLEELQGARSHMRRLTLDCYKELEIYYYDVAQKFCEMPPEEQERYLTAEEGFCTTFVTLDNGRFWQPFCSHREKAIEEARLAKEAETNSTDEAYKHYELMVNEYIDMEQLIDTYYERLLNCREEESRLRHRNLKEQSEASRFLNAQASFVACVVCMIILQIIFYLCGCKN